MPLDAYLVEDSEGAIYYVAAESLQEAVSHTRAELATYNGQPDLTVNEASVKKVNAQKHKFYDEGFGREITFAEALDFCSPGVIACSEW